MLNNLSRIRLIYKLTILSFIIIVFNFFRPIDTLIYNILYHDINLIYVFPDTFKPIN